MNLYEYLFGFKIESPVDRLIRNAKIPTNILEQCFIYKHFRKDVQLVDLEANTLAKYRYDAMYCWKEFEVDDQIWFQISKVYCPKDKSNKREMLR